MAIAKIELRADDIMTRDPMTVEPSTTIRELAKVFEEHEISGVPVVDTGGKVMGVVSKTDLIRRCSEGTSDIPPAYLFEILSEQGSEEETSEVMPEPLVCVEDFMTEDPVVVSPGTPVRQVANLMFDKRVHRVIVVDEELFPVGIITSMDLIGALAR